MDSFVCSTLSKEALNLEQLFPLYIDVNKKLVWSFKIRKQ